MAQVPIFNQQTVADRHIAHGYQDVSINGDMIGENIVRANYLLGKATARISDKINAQLDEYNRTKIVDLTNKYDEYANQTLYDKDNGYFQKKGQNAAGQTDNIMQGFDEYATQLVEESGLKGRYKNVAINTLTQKRNGFYKSVTQHDYDETMNWQSAVYTEKENNYLNKAIHDRYDDNLLSENLKQGCNAVTLHGQMKGLDSDSINVEKMKFTSSFHEGVINALVTEGNPRATSYLEAHKNEILPNKYNSLLNGVKNNQLKYDAREMSRNIITSAKSEQDALLKAESIEDVYLSDAVVSNIKRHYSQEEHFRDLEQREALNGFYNKAVQAEQGGTPLSYDDIPDNLDPEDKLSLMNYINKNGQPDSDPQIWESLYDMQVNNAQGFAKEDLNKYRGFLSDGEFKQFTKAQEEIRTGKFYSNIKDDNEMINAALKEMKLTSDGKRASAYSEIRSMVREFEARKGRTITDDELMSITNSLGYKGEDGVQLYKQLEQGMKKRTGFIKDVMNDFVYYQNQHNGQLPPSDEKYKIIQNRVNQEVQKQKTQAQRTIENYSFNAATMRNIAYTVPRPNEQKVLTYFADNQIPTIGKQLGLKLAVTSRYRNQTGSHHQEGRAADVSMSEHNIKDRIRIYEKLLALPTIHAIGTSDPNILAHFNGNKKLVDERQYDKQHGTNHVNHAHITLINANPAKPTNIASSNIYRF